MKARTLDIKQRIASAQSDVDDLEWELELARERVEELYEEQDKEVEATIWPTKAVLLAIYGAPGNWPVEAAD